MLASGGPPSVSVVIPTYKHADFVLSALESAFVQTFGNVEIIVINDGSPDDTRKLLIPLADAGKIVYVEQSNSGVANARNKGLELASGEFIAFLDDDDVWYPDKLEWQSEALCPNESVCGVCGEADWLGDPPAGHGVSHVPALIDLATLLNGNPIRTPGQTLFRTELVRQVGGFDQSIAGADDWDLYLKLARIKPILGVQRRCIQYRWHSGNNSRSYWRMWSGLRRVYLRHYRRVYRFSPARFLWAFEGAAFYNYTIGRDYRPSGLGDTLLHKARMAYLRVPRIARVLPQKLGLRKAGSGSA